MPTQKRLKVAEPGDYYMEVLVDGQVDYTRSGVTEAVSKGYDTFLVGVTVNEGDQLFVQASHGKYRIVVTASGLTVTPYTDSRAVAPSDATAKGE